VAELVNPVKTAVPAAFVALGLGAAFWELLRALPALYLDSDGYYSHGLLVPVIAGYIAYRNWPKLRCVPLEPSLWALLPLAAVLVLLRPATATSMLSLLSFLLVASLLSGVWFVAGWRWMTGLAPPILYLLVGLPVWSMAINTYTNPLQLLSTSVAESLLRVCRFDLLRDGTTIHLDHFVLDVGVPCSGLKLTVALGAFCLFFVLIARLRLWANLALALLVVPLAVAFNGLRIALVGMVGETWGDAAGRSFHDYSGYAMLLVCFFTLFKIARWLGWKD
jgi:exosortase